MRTAAEADAHDRGKRPFNLRKPVVPSIQRSFRAKHHASAEFILPGETLKARRDENCIVTTGLSAGFLSAATPRPAPPDSAKKDRLTQNSPCRCSAHDRLETKCSQTNMHERPDTIPEAESPPSYFFSLAERRSLISCVLASSTIFCVTFTFMASRRLTMSTFPARAANRIGVSPFLFGKSSLAL